MEDKRSAAWLQLAGVLGFSGILFGALHGGGEGTPAPPGSKEPSGKSISRSIRILALGDINLGRRVGQQILRGDTLYPFRHVRDTLVSYDVVFANLESNISEQHGRTEHPRNNIIFTAPPAAAQALKWAGITVVSTANNHALDFGVRARDQTMSYLDSVGIAHCGTALGTNDLFSPAVLKIKGFRLAFFAVTDIMNMIDPRWKRYVAYADTGALLPAVRAVRDSVDVVIVSFHGGEEYADHVTTRTRTFARDVLRGGVDVFLGHHPHIPYGIEEGEKGIAVHSLGNFVFFQPDRYWTRFSYAVSVSIVRDDRGTRCEGLRCLPLKADFQPEFLTAGEDSVKIMKRILALSSHDGTERLAW